MSRFEGHAVRDDLLGLFVGIAAAISVFAESTLVWTPVAAAVSLVAFSRVASGYRFATADWAMLLLTLLTGLSLAWTLSTQATGTAARTQLGAFAAFLLVRAVARNRRGWVLVASGFIAGCLVAVGIIWSRSGLRLSPGFSQDRAVLDLNQNHLAYSMCVGLLLAAILWRTLDGGRVVLPATALLMILGMNEAGTRGALIALVGLLAWGLVYRFWPVWGLRALLAIAAVAGYAALTGVADQALRGYVTASLRETGDLNGRLAVWPVARQIFESHPLFGIGAGAFREANPVQIVAHNAVLEVASGLGIIGLALFTASLYFPLVAETRRYPTRVRGLYVGGLVALALPILMSGHYHQAPAFWIAVALVSRLDAVLGRGSERVEVGEGQRRLATVDQRSTYRFSTASREKSR